MLCFTEHSANVEVPYKHIKLWTEQKKLSVQKDTKALNLDKNFHLFPSSMNLKNKYVTFGV